VDPKDLDEFRKAWIFLHIVIDIKTAIVFLSIVAKININSPEDEPSRNAAVEG
jgi:hypothetical protein